MIVSWNAYQPANQTLTLPSELIMTSKI